MLRVRGVDTRDVTVRGYRIHRYRLSGLGSGPPLVLLHGLGSSANAFSRVFFHLQPHFRSIWAFDLPGNGFSPLPDSGPVPVETNVRVLLDFIREQVQEPVVLSGNSLGGAMSLFAASEEPHQVKGLSLVAPAGAQVAPARWNALKNSLDVKTRREARAISRRLFHRPPWVFSLFAGQFQLLYGSPAVRGVLQEIKETDFVPPERLDRLSMPIQLIWGRSEKLLPYESIHYFREHLPAHAEIHEVPDFGHIPQMEHPAELSRMIIDFAKRHF